MGVMRGSYTLLGCLLLSLVSSRATLAQAQTSGGLSGNDRSFDVQLFHPPVGTNGFLTLDSAEAPEHGRLSLGLLGNYQFGPFGLESSIEGSTSHIDVVRHQATSELYGAVGLLDRFELGVAIPMTLRLSGDDYTIAGQRAGQGLHATGIGDIRIEGKAQIFSFGVDQAFLFAISAGGTLPTGDESKFLGDKGPTGRLRGLLEWQAADKVRTVLMGGVLLRESSAAFGTKVGSQALFGGGIDYRVLRDMSVLAEINGRASSRYSDSNPAELDLAMRAYLPHRITLLLGGGLGLNRGLGAPVARGYVGLGWAPDFRDRDHDGSYDYQDICPDEPEDRDGFRDEDGCPDPDNDADGIADEADRCPGEPEDVDGFQDEDGCPDLDNDGDGIPDLNDACPRAKEDGQGKRPHDGCPSTVEDNDGDGIFDVKDKCADEPEDFDAFQDDDGCPDIDNDNDSIPDQYDSCSNEAEDADGFEDEDGCPDPDNDKDGIVDAKDKCPLQPETLNGIKDDDGCPDEGAELIELGDTEIEVFERVAFLSGTAQLTPMGQTVVKAVAMVMRGHPELALVRVEARGIGVSRQTTQWRAEAVAKELKAQGVDPKRLKAAGMGAGSGRVEFIIESRVEPRKAGAPTPEAAPAEMPAPIPAPSPTELPPPEAGEVSAPAQEQP